MSLNFNLATLMLAIVLTSAAQAHAPMSAEYLSIQSMEVTELSEDYLGLADVDPQDDEDPFADDEDDEDLITGPAYRRNNLGDPFGSGFGGKRSSLYRNNFPNKYGRVMPNQTTQAEGLPAQIIATARDLVALGEDVYKLVTKGKPSNTTTYEPISVVPKINGVAADILETEGWSIPVKRTYEVTYKNFYGMKVVKFRYSVIFAHGGSYNGAGSYITAAQIIPESVETLFGFDFTATMKLGGIQNHGTRDNPTAGAILLLEFSVVSMVKASLHVQSFHITGLGGFKKY